MQSCIACNHIHLSHLSVPRYVRCEQKMLEAVNNEDDLAKLRKLVRHDSRVDSKKVKECTTQSELRQLWDESVVQKVEPVLTLAEFKDLIIIMACQGQGASKVAPSDAEHMSQQAFELLDTDLSGTMSFDEFEVCRSVAYGSHSEHVCLSARVGNFQDPFSAAWE